MFTMNSGRYQWLERCVSGSAGSHTLELSTDVQEHEFCPGDGTVFFGPRQQIPTEDPPECATE
jgi:hypothetical protein